MLPSKTLRKVNIGIYVSSKHTTLDIKRSLAALDFGNTFPIHQCFLYQDGHEVFEHHEFSFHHSLSTKREKGKDYFFKHLSNTSGNDAILFMEAGVLLSTQALTKGLLLLNKFHQYNFLTPGSYEKLEKKSSLLNWMEFKKRADEKESSLKFSLSELRNNYVLVRKSALENIEIVGFQAKSNHQFSDRNEKIQAINFQKDILKEKSFSSQTLPLISCVLPTANRALFLNQSLLYFQEQSYPNKELIIVFNSSEDLPQDLNLSENIKLVQSNSTSIGAKRNEGCRQANGLIIAQWDDDDIYHPNRLEIQAKPILEGGCEISALGNISFFGLDDWSFWNCSEKLHQSIFAEDVAGGTLVFLKKVWELTGPYPNTSLREDADFLLKAGKRGARLKKLDGSELFVYLRHEANSWQFPLGKFLSPKAWIKNEIFPLVERNLDFYQKTRDTIKSKRTPLVSCIMPTADRPSFIEKAISQFIKQDFEEKELIIADNGIYSIEHLIPKIENIKYYRLQSGQSLGTIRNFCCSKAQSKVIMHWDDDDFYAHDWISFQYSVLKEESADICGLSQLYFYNSDQDESWKYQYPLEEKKWVAGATMAYTRQFWLQNPFPQITIGEDNLFVWSGNPKVFSHKYQQGFIATIHSSNTSRKKTGSRRWTKTSMEENERIARAYFHKEAEQTNTIKSLISSIQMNNLKYCKPENYSEALAFENKLGLEVLIAKFLKENKSRIPKHIHQVWIGNKTPPWEWINTFKQKLTKNHPDWDYTLWREEDIEKLNLVNQWAYDDEVQISGKVNILRYELLFQFGGIYIDADMEWLNENPLDKLIDETNYTAMFAGKEDDHLLANSVIGSSKNNPILAVLIQVLKESYSITRNTWKLATWQATGPKFFTEICKTYNITQFPSYYFYPVSWLKNHVGIDTSQFPHSYMIQYGYSTNNLGALPQSSGRKNQ